ACMRQCTPLQRAELKSGTARSRFSSIACRGRDTAGLAREPAAGLRRSMEGQFESFDDGVNEAVGSCGTGVPGDVGPDLLEVLLGQSRQPIGHLRLLGASHTTARLDPLSELPT